MGRSHVELHLQMLTRVLEVGQSASFAPQKLAPSCTIKVVLAWVLASVPHGTDVGVRFLPLPAVCDALFGQAEIIFFRFGTAA